MKMFNPRLFATTLVISALLFASADRAPAPILETPDQATPSPSQESRTPKPHPKRKRTETSEKPSPNKSESPKPQPIQLPLPFAGTWTGIMNCGLGGNIEHTIQIDGSQTQMSVWQTQDPSVRVDGPAQVTGDTIAADYGWSGGWSVTPYPDGHTAKVRYTAFLLDSTAVFRRQNTGGNEVANKPASGTSSSAQPGIPTAKAVPDRPGFVYNPFNSAANHLLDVRGRASGTKVKDPTSGKLFIVP
jgi:cytoskeletal protein RodZ